MKVTVVCVGKLKEKYWRDAIAEYSKRLSRYMKLEIIELADEKAPENMSDAQAAEVKEREGQRILKNVKDDAFAVALAVEGKMLSSEELAEKLNEIGNTTGSLCLVIGSSHGLSPRVKNTAAWRLSVSRLTFPHQMMRVILLETLYRSLSILAGTKYHK